MKPHFIVQTRTPLSQPIRHWREVLLEKSGVSTTFSPDLSSILAQFGLPALWVTSEYAPANQHAWSPEEISSGLNRIYRLILQQDAQLPSGFLNQIRLLPQIEMVRMGSISATNLPDTQRATAQTFSQKYRPNYLFLEESHQFSQGSPEIKVAVLDTGIQTNHPEIAHALAHGMDFVDIIDGATEFIGDFLNVDDAPEDEVGHGTHVAGILAARGLQMPIGVVPNCQIIPVRVLGAMRKGGSIVGAGFIDNINNGIKWAVDAGADVINMSLGLKHAGGGLPHEEVIKYAVSKGVTIVAASGNDGTEERYYPGALPGVVAVGATNPNGEMAFFSTFGGHVSFVAPGEDIYSASLNGKYMLASGTSQAAPSVAGAVALLKSYSKKEFGHVLSDSQVKFLLKNTADRPDRFFKNNKSGFGSVNLLDALKLLQHKMSARTHL
jgi:thermitase